MFEYIIILTFNEYNFFTTCVVYVGVQNKFKKLRHSVNKGNEFHSFFIFKTVLDRNTLIRIRRFRSVTDRFVNKINHEYNFHGFSFCLEYTGGTAAERG